MSRRFHFPGPQYPAAWVELPDEWLGEHLMKRDAAARAASHFNDGKITIAAISLCLADDWGGIPGLEGRDPTKWDFAKVPILIMVWLEREVFDDFAKAFTVPKVYSPPSPRGWMDLWASLKRKITVGSSAPAR
jgi:hypothetical protein